MTGWEKTLGIFVIFLFCYLGLLIFDDKRLKLVSFFTAIISAVMLVGWSEEIIISAQRFAENVNIAGFTENVNAVGVVTSLPALGFSSLLPSKSLRRAGYSLSLSGITASLLGLPGWIIWLIVGAIVALFFVIIYIIGKKVAKWVTALVRGV
jgi:hypothetical protein